MAVAKRAQGAQSKLTMAFETDFGVTPVSYTHLTLPTT